MSRAPSTLAAVLVCALASVSHASDDVAEEAFVGMSVVGDGVTPGSQQLFAGLAVESHASRQAVAAGSDGGLTHQIGLELPPALLQPALSLTYSSGAGPQSWLGRGWSLSTGMTISELSAAELAGAYQIDVVDDVEPVRIAGGGLDGLLVWDGAGWTYRSASPVWVDATLLDDRWTIRSGGSTTVLERATGDRWVTHTMSDAVGNLVELDWAGDQLLELRLGGTDAAAGGLPHTHTVVATYSPVPDEHVTVRWGRGTKSVYDERLSRLEVVATAAGCAELDCDADDILAAWDVCYVPLGDAPDAEQVVGEIYRSTASVDGCAVGPLEGATLRVAAMDYTQPGPFAPSAGVVVPFGFGLTETTDSRWTSVTGELADLSGDGWVDAIDWAAEGAVGLLARLDVPDVPVPPEWDVPSALTAPEDAPAAGVSVSVLTWAGPVDGHETRENTRYTTQRWVDVDGDGHRDLVVADHDPVPFAPLDHVERDDAYDANFDTGSTWTVHWGAPGGWAGTDVVGAPVDFPGIHRTEPLPMTAYDDLIGTEFPQPGPEVELMDLDSDGHVDLVHARGDDGLRVRFGTGDRADPWGEAAGADWVDIAVPIGVPGTQLAVGWVDAIDVEHGDLIAQVPEIAETWTTARFVDLNGDGLSDLVVAAPDGWRVAWNRGDRSFGPLVSIVGPEDVDEVPYGYLGLAEEGHAAIADCPSSGVGPADPTLSGRYIAYAHDLGVDSDDDLDEGMYDPVSDPVFCGARELVPMRRWADLIDVDGDGLVDFVDAAAGRWNRNLGGGFAASAPVPWAELDGLPLSEVETVGFAKAGRAPHLDPRPRGTTSARTVRQVQDANGDGLLDVFRTGADGDARFELGVHTPAGLMTWFEQSAGAQTEVTWQSSAFAWPAGDPWADPLLPRHRQLVGSVTTEDPVTGQSARQVMVYEDGQLVDGVFEGFATRRVFEDFRDPGTEVRVGDAWVEWSAEETLYALDRDFTRPALVSTWIDPSLPWAPDAGEPWNAGGKSAAMDGVLARTVTSVWIDDPAFGRRLEGQVVTEYPDAGPPRSRADALLWSEDAPWRLLERSTWEGDDPSSVPGHAVTVSLDHRQAEDRPLDVVVSRETRSPSPDGGTEIVERVEYSYDDRPWGASPTDGLLRVESLCSGPLDDLCGDREQWSYERNARGALARIEKPGGQVTTNTALALGGALVLEHENALGWATSIAYDGMGRLIHTVDPNLVEVRTVRDALGRQTAELLTGVGVSPREVATWTYQSSSAPTWTTETRPVWRTPGDPDPTLVQSHVVYDGLGREAQRWTAGGSGAVGYDVVDTYHNLAGDLRYQSEPYGAGVFTDTLVGAWNRTAAQRVYPDGLGLPRRTYAPHTGWSLLDVPAAGQRRTTEPTGLRRVLETDVHGRLRSVDEGDPSAGPLSRTADYAYDGQGRLRGYVDANGNAYTYTFDGAGRLIEANRRGVDEPSASSWRSYAYDGPWPYRQYDADGVAVVEWHFDELGRPLQKTTNLHATPPDVYNWNWSEVWHGALAERVDPHGSVVYTHETAGGFGVGHVLSETRHWTDHPSKTWTYQRDSAGRETSVVWPGGVEVHNTYAETTGWLEGHALVVGADIHHVTYHPGSHGAHDDGWAMAFQLDWLDLTINRPVPGRVSKVAMETPHGIDWVDFEHDDGGRITRRSYRRGPAEWTYDYRYDRLGRIDEVRELGAPSPTEAYLYDDLGVPQAVTSQGLDWTYDASPRFGEVPQRTEPGGATEQLGWDAANGRLAWRGYAAPSDSWRQDYTYDGLGRLTHVVQSSPTGLELWRHAIGYDAANERVWEERWEAGSPTRQVWRHQGYEHDTTVGETLRVLPMARVVDGEVRWLAQEPDGRAPFVYTTDGLLESMEIQGATGESLYSSGGVPWHQDHMHGAQIDRSLGLVHHGVRHARVGDGLWLQPEPLNYLGPAAAHLETPLGFGPVYAAGNSNLTSDRKGMFPPLLVGVGVMIAKEVATEVAIQAVYHYAGDEVGLATEIVLSVTSPGQILKNGARQFAKRGGLELVEAGARKGAKMAGEAVQTAKKALTSGKCFVAGTRVVVPGGETAIEDVEVGDWVVASDVAGPPRCGSAAMEPGRSNAVHTDADGARGCAAAPGPDDHVTDLVHGERVRLDSASVGSDVVFGGRVWRVTDEGVRATGDVLARVVDTFSRTAPEVVDAVLAHGDGSIDTLTATPNHPFWVDAVRDYVPLGELEVGTVLHVQGGGEAILVSKTWRQGDFEVFDFEVEGRHNFYVRGAAGDAAGVLVHNSTSKGAETIVRRVSPAEAEAMVDAGGLVPKPGSRSAKWVSEGAPQSSLPKKGHEKTVTMTVDAGTTDWLKSQSTDYMDVAGEAALPGGVLTKSNEPGALGVGVDLLRNFNSRVRKVDVK